jgi:hypothetical protein
MQTARIPPVDPAPATITAALAMHAGHICYPSFGLPICIFLSWIAVFRENLHSSGRSARPQLPSPGSRAQLGTYLYLNVARRFLQMHVGAHILAVSFGPTAHTPEWPDDRPAKTGQRILEGPGPRSGRAPGDQSRRFQIAQSSGEHALGNVSHVAAQLPVPVRPFFQREEDLRRPSADKDRARVFDPRGIFVAALAASFRSRYNPLLGAHEINLTRNVEMPGVTSVAGFQSQQNAGSTWTR